MSSDWDEPTFDTPRRRPFWLTLLRPFTRARQAVQQPQHGAYCVYAIGNRGSARFARCAAYADARAALLVRSKELCAGGWTVAQFEDYPPSCAVRLTRPAEWGGTMELELRVIGGSE